MKYSIQTTGDAKRIALVAHDNMKALLIEWASKHKEQLLPHTLFATGTTGSRISQALDLDVHRLLSGPLGGDQQIGTMIATNEIDILIFFWDPLEAQPHDPDVKALLRLAAVWNVPVACTPATADMLITSNMFAASYQRKVPDYQAYSSSRESS